MTCWWSPCFFRFALMVWNAGMAYGCEITSQLSFWLVTTLTDLFHHAKPAHSPVSPFCPATVTQTWLLFAPALPRMHINTISCSTGSNTCTCAWLHTHTRYPYMLPHPNAPFDTKSGLTPLVPFSQPVMTRNRWISQTHCQQKVVLTLTLCLCSNQHSPNVSYFKVHMYLHSGYLCVCLLCLSSLSWLYVMNNESNM